MGTVVGVVVFGTRSGTGSINALSNVLWGTRLPLYDAFSMYTTLRIIQLFRFIFLISLDHRDLYDVVLQGIPLQHQTGPMHEPVRKGVRIETVTLSAYHTLRH